MSEHPRAPSKLPHTPRPMVRVSTGLGPGSVNRESEPQPRMHEAAMAVLLHWQENHTPVTTRDVGKRMHLRSSSTVYSHLVAATCAGLIEKRGTHYWPKEMCVCPNCGASHVSEQSA